MNDFRCGNCNKLLAKIDGKSRVEIKCPKCKTVNVMTELMSFEESKVPDIPVMFGDKRIL